MFWASITAPTLFNFYFRFKLLFVFVWNYPYTEAINGSWVWRRQRWPKGKWNPCLIPLETLSCKDWIFSCSKVEDETCSLLPAFSFSILIWKNFLVFPYWLIKFIWIPSLYVCWSTRMCDVPCDQSLPLCILILISQILGLWLVHLLFSFCIFYIYERVCFTTSQAHLAQW